MEKYSEKVFLLAQTEFKKTLLKCGSEIRTVLVGTCKF